MQDAKEDLEIRKQTSAEIKANEKQEDLPIYYTKLKLSKDQKDALVKKAFEEFEAMKDERASLKLDKTWKSSDAQYDGVLDVTNSRLRFALSTKQSKIKIDAIIRSCNQAFLDQDPKFAITPRPEFNRQGGDAAAQKQQDFLDYELDENIKPNSEYTKIWGTAFKKYVGIQKLMWDYRTEPRTREEKYIGKPEVVGADDRGPIIKNEGLEAFLKNYPDAQTEYPGLIKQLVNGEEINVVVKYNATVRNCAKIKSVNIEDFYVKNSTNGNEGLKRAHCIVERQPYSWWELKEKERTEEFENVDALKTQDQKDSNGKPVVKSEHDDFDVLEFTTYLEEEGQDPKKIKFWAGEHSKSWLGGSEYPYCDIPSDYKAYTPWDNGKGFYGNGESVMWHLRDSNIAQDAFLNLALHGLYARSILTPITKEGDSITEQLLDKRWTDGVPLIVDDMTDDVNKAVSFVRYPNINVGDMVNIIGMLKKQDGDISGVSDLMTGRESPLDPEAPATKTLALLQQASQNIKDYINNMMESFSETGAELLMLYYQMSNDKVMYRVKRDSREITGGDIFDGIGKDELAAKTNIQTRAWLFAIDKLNEKKENLALYQLLRQDPIALTRPKTVYAALVQVVKSWSPQWKNMADKYFPSMDQMDQEQQQAVVQALQLLFAQAQQKAQVTGVQQNPTMPEMKQAGVEGQQRDMFGATPQEMAQNK